LRSAHCALLIALCALRSAHCALLSKEPVLKEGDFGIPFGDHPFKLERYRED